MSRLTVLLLAACFVLPGVSMAEDIWDPPWVTDPSNPEWAGGNTTYQTWEFENEQFPFEPDIVENPYGWPTADVEGTPYNWGPTTNPDGTPSGGILIDPGGTTGGTIKITINNHPPDWEKKVIMLQVTSDKAPNAGGTTVTGTNADGTTSGGTSTPLPPGIDSNVGHLSPPNAPSPAGRSWYTYTSMWEIRPNPESETIEVDFPQDTWVGEIVVDTICVPEPATMSLLALGGLGFIRRRR